MKNGGPAFPIYIPGIEFGAGPTCNDGMSLRDYFAAHAPARPLWQFAVRGFEKRPKPNYTREFQPEHETSNSAALTEWDSNKSIAERQQWPYVWADEMLKAREPQSHADNLKSNQGEAK